MELYFIDWRPSGWNKYNFHVFLVVYGTEKDKIVRFALDPFWSFSAPVLQLHEFLELFPEGRAVIRRPGWDINGFDRMDPGPRFKKTYQKTIKINAEKMGAIDSAPLLSLKHLNE